MKRILVMGLLVFIAVAAWRIGDALSSDALSMAIGIVFGAMAGVPTALLVMAGGRRRERDESSTGRHQAPPQAQHYPVVVLANGAPQIPVQGMQQPHYGQPAMPQDAWPSSGPTRQFKVVGEQEMWIEE